MKKSILLLATLLFVAGCEQKTTGSKKPGQVSVDPVKNDLSVELYRVYHVSLSQGRELKIKSEQITYVHLDPDGIEFYAYLIQPGGNEISFDCDNIADKIIDSRLVDEIRPYCKWVHEDAVTFWKKTPPSEFTTDDGVTWVRKP